MKYHFDAGIFTGTDIASYPDNLGMRLVQTRKDSFLIISHKLHKQKTMCNRHIM